MDLAPSLELKEAPETPPPAPEPIKTRHPSRFFTEYYASAFLFLLSSFVLVAFLVLRPLILQIRETNAQTEARIGQISAERSYLASLDQSVAAAQSIPAETLSDVQRALPNEQNVPSLLVQFGSAAANNNLRIDSISFSDNRATAKAATSSLVIPLDVNLAIHARSYFDVKRFLSEVETSLRIMDVISISSSAAGGELTYTLQLRAYTFIPTAPRPAASP